MKDGKIHSPPIVLDLYLDLAVLSLDKKNVVGMVTLDYMVSSKVAGLPLIHKTPHVSLPTNGSPNYYVYLPNNPTLFTGLKFSLTGGVLFLKE